MNYVYEKKVLIFTKEVAQTFESYRQIGSIQHEAGGILLGRVFQDKIVIEKITTPSEVDKSGRYYFERNIKKAQWFVDLSWRHSGGEVIYLGEWHTHPEKAPHPSDVDCKLITNMLKDTKMSINFLFLVIIGLEDNYVAVQSVGKLKKLVVLKRLL